MPPNTTYDVEAFLNHHWLPGIADQIGNLSALMKVLMQSQGIVGLTDPSKPGLSKMVTGGTQIKKTLFTAMPTAAGSFKKFSPLKTTPNNQFDYALFDWASYYVAVPMSFDDELAARGPEQVLEYNAGRLTAAMVKMKDLICTGLYNHAAALTGSYNDEQGFGLQGLRLICAQSRATNYGSIEESTYTYWKSGLENTTAYSQADLSDPTNANNIYNLLRAGIDSCRKARREPTHIMVSPLIFNLLEDFAISRQMFSGTKVQEALLGYKYMDIHGTHIVREETTYLPDQYHAFLLNINTGVDSTMELVGREGAWFLLTDRIPVVNQMANVRYLVSQCALVCTEPRLCGMFTGLGNG